MNVSLPLLQDSLAYAWKLSFSSKQKKEYITAQEKAFSFPSKRVNLGPWKNAGCNRILYHFKYNIQRDIYLF